MNTLIGGRLFQNISRRLPKFRENRPRDVKKSVDGKKNKKHDQNITVFAIAGAITGECNEEKIGRKKQIAVTPATPGGRLNKCKWLKAAPD